VFRAQQTAIAIAGGCEQAKYSENGYKAHAAKCSLQVPLRYVTFGAGTQRPLRLFSTFASTSALHDSLSVAAAGHADDGSKQQRAGLRYCNFLMPHSRIPGDGSALVLFKIHCLVDRIHPCRKATCASIILCSLIGPISILRGAEWEAACENPALI
jgi:hypothetical protein